MTIGTMTTQEALDHLAGMTTEEIIAWMEVQDG